MFSFERVLCPSDFSPFARRALATSLALTRPGGAVRALHVVSPARSRTRHAGACPAPVLVSEDRERLVEDLERFTEPARARGLRTEVAVGYGEVADAIVEEARSWPADVVAVGTRGLCAPNGWAVGSVTEGVLRQSGCPVLAVPRSTRAGADPTAPFRRILCPIDFSEPSLEALRCAIDFARESAACLILLHILEWFPEEEARPDLPLVVPEYHLDLTQEARERMRRAVPAHALEGVDHEELVATGRPYRAILRVCREREADLVVLGIHGRRAIDHVLAGATVCHVIREAGCPILAVRPG
jgi:nucleotide-binding universal stress UspA family protein